MRVALQGHHLASVSEGGIPLDGGVLGLKGGEGLLRHRHEGQSEDVGRQPHQAEERLGSGGVAIYEEEAEGLLEEPVGVERLLILPFSEQVNHLGKGGGVGVADHGDHAVDAHRHEGEGDGVVTREDKEVLRCAMPNEIDLPNDAARLLDADDGGAVVGKADGGLGEHIYPGARGDVVDDDRDGRRLGDGAEVAVEPLLGGLVVEGADHQGGIDAGEVHRGEAGDHLEGAIGGDADDERQAVLIVLHEGPDDPVLLLLRERGGLGRGAEGDEEVRLALYLAVDQLAEAVVVDALGGVISEGRHHRRPEAAEV